MPNPTITGTRIGSSDGTIISLIAALVSMSTATPYSGFAVPSMMPAISRNWRRTSTTTAPAAVPTATTSTKLYFETGKAELPADGSKSIAAIAAAAKASEGALAVFGYHDAAGNLEQNQELAKQRALKVREALKAAGVPDEKIELKKPEQTLASGPAEEARRVEVTLK